MPGIAGIITRNAPEKTEGKLGSMITCMIHEPFYSRGTLAHQQIGLYVGWVCLKGGFSDCMPVYNEEKNIILVSTGENFADKEVFDRLKLRGHEFDPFNAGYLVHMYEESGEEFLNDLNGWFSGILVDLREGKIFLFNDRFGMNRIYYHEDKEEFIFSSEAKSLLKIRAELRELDLKSLAEFWSCDCVLRNRTIFTGVSLLPGGSVWTFENGKNVEKRFYFKPAQWEVQPMLGTAAFQDRVKQTLANILPRYFRQRGQLGMSLTGGLDSRIILSYINVPAGELPCYTFGGVYGDCYDIQVARKVADAYGQTHHVLRLDGSFFSRFSFLAEKAVYITDGCLDVCGAHDIYFNQLAREIAPIRITGKFGGEVLRSASTFKYTSPSKWLFDGDFRKCLDEAAIIFRDVSKGPRLSFTVFKEIPWHMYGCVAAEQSQLTLRTPYMDKDFLALMYQAPPDVFTTKAHSLRLIQEGNRTLFEIATDLGYGGGSNFAYSKCLQMYHWLLFKTEWYYNDGMPHFAAWFDYAFRSLHPERLISDNNKFLHYRTWFRDELSDYVKEILLDRRAAMRPYLNAHFLGEMVRRHMGGYRNYVNELNKTLTIELIYRLFIENM